MPNNEMQSTGFDLLGSFDALRRRWRWLMLGPLLGGALGLALSWLLPGSYRSEATLLVESPWFPQGLVPNMLGSSLRERLQAQRFVLTSDEAVDAIAQAVGPERLGADEDERAAALRRGFELEIADAASVDAAVVRFVFVARDPELARDAVGALAAHAIERSRAQGERHAAATMAVLREELEKVAQDLAERSDQLAALAARRRTPIGSVDAELEAARAEHLAELNALRALEGEVARAEARYTAKHPALLQLHEELAHQRALVSAPPRGATLPSASLESDLEYRALLREYETSLKSYESLLSRQIDATMASRLGRGGDMPEIRVLREPTLPLRPQATLPFPALGAICGLGLAALAALWPTLLRPSFSRVATLEAASGLPVVAALPELTGVAQGARGLAAPESLAGEQFRRVLPYLARAGATPVVLVTAAARGVGTSWCTANLGAAVAASGQRRALLIDANLRDPSLHAWASVPPGPGLVECVRGDLSLSTALVLTPTPNLYLLRAGGGGAGDGLATLDDERLGKLLEQARRDFDAVFVDAPPRGVVVDTELLERVATQILVVVRAEHTPRTSVQRALRGVQLPTGLVLNRMDVRAHRAHFGVDSAGPSYGRDERRR